MVVISDNEPADIVDAADVHRLGNAVSVNDCFPADDQVPPPVFRNIIAGVFSTVAGHEMVEKSSGEPVFGILSGSGKHGAGGIPEIFREAALRRIDIYAHAKHSILQHSAFQIQCSFRQNPTDLLSPNVDIVDPFDLHSFL